MSESSTYTVRGCPTVSLLLTGCLIVHPSDFDQGRHVLVNNKFPFTTRHDDTKTLQQGEVALSRKQGEWIGLSSDPVTIKSLDLPRLESVDLEVAFRQRDGVSAEEYSAEEMINLFVKTFAGQIFGLGQTRFFIFHEKPLEAVVKCLNTRERATSNGDMGVLTDKTCVTFKAADSTISMNDDKKPPSKNLLDRHFKLEDNGIGGLDSCFNSISRRAFASRVYTPSLANELGIQHVKGILLFGPPGTGKTLMARQIGALLNARDVKIVSGPEILDKYVGESESKIRQLFADAELEYAERREKSGLHLIILDELDAICKHRGSGSDGGNVVGDSIVNQLLSKMDGVNQLNNILLIGTTNRLDMIDKGLLRPGRFEIQIEVSLPDEEGRQQILEIHTKKMQENKRMDTNVKLPDLAKKTKNFSGAEISGLVKSATSFAYYRHAKAGTSSDNSDNFENLKVNKYDFELALKEVKPAFGGSVEELTKAIENGIYAYSQNTESILKRGALFVEQVSKGKHTPCLTMLLHGPLGSGKTALAAKIALNSEFPFIKVISPDNMVGLSESQQVTAINEIFEDSYRSPLSVVALDNIERLLCWTSVGQHFSNLILQALLVLLQKVPPKGHRLLIIVTTAELRALQALGLFGIFDANLYVPPITSLIAVKSVLQEFDEFKNEETLMQTMALLKSARFGEGSGQPPRKLKIGIKKLLRLIEMARLNLDDVGQKFVDSLIELGASTGEPRDSDDVN